MATKKKTTTKKTHTKTKTKPKRDWGKAAAAAGRVQAQQDETNRERREAVAERSERMALSRIQPRGADTRPLNADHVAALAESIAVLNLLEPLVVDQNGRLLAGGHRLAALQSLKEARPGDFAKLFPKDEVPVRLLDFDADANTALAMDIEVAENEHRRDYTAGELKQIVTRLQEAGYTIRSGRPREGEKPLKEAVARIIGKSQRTVERLLAGLEGAGKGNPDADIAARERAILIGLENAIRRYIRFVGREDLASDASRDSLRTRLERSLPFINKLCGDTSGDK